MDKKYACQGCPCYADCAANYRSSDCAANRAALNQNYEHDPNIDFRFRERVAQRTMIDAWLHNDHDIQFERQLRIWIQKRMRTQREAIVPSEQNAYELGVTAGYCRAIEDLYRNKLRIQYVESYITRSSSLSREEMCALLKYLYENPEGTSAEDLAKAINVSPDKLAHELQCNMDRDIIEHISLWKKDRYFLLDLGRTYVEQKIIPLDEKAKAAP